MEDKLNDDSSHYEISLTATQAFVAFVLLLLSLAASFVFGIVIGRGQFDAEVARRQQQAQTTEITEKPIAPGDATAVATAAEAIPEPAPPTAAPGRKTPDVPFEIKPVATPAPGSVEDSKAAGAQPAAEAVVGPAYAQLLATSDAKRAEALAAKLIDAGFTTAYVDRMKTDKGTIHRVRVKFKSDPDARAALPKLQTFATEKVIVTRQ